MRRASTILLGLGMLAAAGPGEARAKVQEVASLTAWDGEARLSSNPGPGETLFLLKAKARWSAEAPRDRARIAVQVTLPDGRVERRTLRPEDGPGSRTITVQVPASAVRNRVPRGVKVGAVLVEASTGERLGAPLLATIDQFPTAGRSARSRPLGPFNRGRPPEPGPDGTILLPGGGPDGWRFVRVPPDGDRAGFFAATTEASNRQLAGRVDGYDPNAGRSDEFLLDDPEQPAIGLTPERAEAYLAALRDSDPTGIRYRLPTRDEWQAAATAGASTPFWWDGDGGFPGGANFFGPEPALEVDSTAAVDGAGFATNRWRLRHTFGNVAEWATEGDGGRFVRMGGNFRTEPAEAIEPVAAEDGEGLGPDPYVGLRPFFSLDAEEGGDRIRAVLAELDGVSGVVVAFDPDRATAVLSGTIDAPGARSQAAERVASLWWVAAVVDEMVVPPAPERRLATIGGQAGPPSGRRVLGQAQIEVPVAVTWEGPQPVSGSDWYVNVFGPSGGHFSHRIGPGDVGRSPVRMTIPVGLIGEDRSTSVALSLGAPAESPGSASRVSELTRLQLSRD